MATQGGSEDGSDIFWPGYVDAVTNLVLNLLFLLTIMTVAVFMFALELGRMKPGKEESVAQVQPVPENAIDPVKERQLAVAELRKQVEALNREAPADVDALKKQIEAINAALDRESKLLRELPIPQKRQPELPNEIEAPQKVLPASSAVPRPERGLAEAVDTGGGIIVRFTEEAVSLTEAEMRTLRSTLAPVAAAGAARIDVVVPRGFSEAKRLGFYRAMAVRNLLIEMKVPADRIDVSVREGRSSSNASLVRVTAR